MANRANVSDTVHLGEPGDGQLRAGDAVRVCSSCAVASIGRNDTANVQPMPSSTQPMMFRGRLATRIEPTPAYGT